MTIRSSRPRGERTGGGRFCEKSVLKNFSKFNGKDLRQSLFFNKVAGSACNFINKKRLWHRCFPVNFEKFLRTTLFIKHLQWLPKNTKLTCRYVDISTVSLQLFFFFLNVLVITKRNKNKNILTNVVDT